MSINVSVGVMIPVDVLEVGQEISADQLAAIQNASMASSANPMITKDKALANAIACMLKYTYNTGNDYDRTACSIENTTILAGNGGNCGLWDGTSMTTGFPVLYTASNPSLTIYVIVGGTLSDFPVT